MATQNSWADLQNDPFMKRLASVGSSALQNGAISKEDAQAMAEHMGIVPKSGAAMGTDQSPNPLAIGVTDKPQGNLDMTAGDLYNSEGVGNIGDRKGAKAVAERSNNTTYKHSSNRFITKSADQTRAEQMQAQGQYPNVSSYEQATDDSGAPQFDRVGNPVLDKDRPIYDFNNVTTDEQNPVRMQQQGLGKMQDLLGIESQYQRDKNHMDFTPLAALSDALNAQHGTPTNLAASAKAPTNDNNFMAYADEIQKRRADIQKAIAEGVKAQKGGTTLDMLTQAVLAKDVAGQVNPANSMQDRLDNTNHQGTLRAIRNDKNLRDKLVQYQNLGNAMSNLTNADHMTPQQFDEAQQAIRANLGIKGSSGVGERERTQMNSLGISADRVMQILNGKPSDIENPEFVNHIRNLAGLETGNIRQQYSSRLNAVAAGNGSMYARRPDLAADLSEAMSANSAQIAPRATSSAPKKAAPKNQAQKASSDLGSMSNDELKAYIKTHGGS